MLVCLYTFMSTRSYRKFERSVLCVLVLVVCSTSTRSCSVYYGEKSRFGTKHTKEGDWIEIKEKGKDTRIGKDNLNTISFGITGSTYTVVVSELDDLAFSVLTAVGSMSHMLMAKECVAIDLSVEQPS